MKSKKPTQASPKKRPSIASQATSNEDINDIIADITLKRARNAFCIYICDMYNKDKGAIYDLQGRKVKKTKRGVYIQDKRKVICK